MITRLAPDDPDAEIAVDDAGDPFERDFTNALACWVYCQDEPPTFEHAALAWNATPAVIRQAVENHFWLFDDNGRIGQEGL